MVNWTYIWHNYDTTAARRRQGHRLRPLPGDRRRASRPGRRTAASASASARTPATWTRRCKAVAVHHVSPENQGVNAELTGNMPASAAGYAVPGRCRRSTRRRCSRCSRRASTRRRHARSRRTGATSPARCRAPGTRRPPSTRPPRRSPQHVHRGRPARKEPAVSTVDDAAPAAKRRAAGRKHVSDRARGREPARPDAGRTRPSS